MFAFMHAKRSILGNSQESVCSFGEGDASNSTISTTMKFSAVRAVEEKLEQLAEDRLRRIIDVSLKLNTNVRSREKDRVFTSDASNTSGGSRKPINHVCFCQRRADITLPITFKNRTSQANLHRMLPNQSSSPISPPFSCTTCPTSGSCGGGLLGRSVIGSGSLITVSSFP